MEFLKLLVTEVLTFLIIIELRGGLSMYFLSVLYRNLLVDQQRSLQDEVALSWFFPLDAELHNLRTVVKWEIVYQQISIQMHARFAGNHVNDVHLIFLGECSLLRCGFDKPIDGLIAYLSQLLIHTLS